MPDACVEPVPFPAPLNFSYTYPWGGPPTEPWEATFGGWLATPGTVIENGQPYSYYVVFYTGDGDTQTCGTHCEFTTDHWAQFGDVSGRITLTNGMPLRGYGVTAVDPLPTPQRTWSKFARTNHDGVYSFASATAKGIYSFLWPNLVDFPIPESNRWGLWLDQTTPGEQPWKLYFMEAGSQQKVALPASGQPATVDFVLPFEDEKKDPPNKNCNGGESAEEDPCQLKDASCTGKPVSVLTGNVFFDHADAVIPGTVPLQLRRTYNSVDAFHGERGLFGPGWTSTYEREIKVIRDGILAMKKSSGNVSYFTELGTSGAFKPYSPASGRSSISRVGGSYLRTLLSGRRETYNEEGRLASLTDPAGNVTTLEFDSAGLLTAVVAPGGRRLSFQYNGGRVARISGPEGVVATYGYDNQGWLIRVTYADGSGYEYAYDQVGQILQVRDLSGRVVESHEYVNGKGITSETADGVEKLTFSYGPSSTTVTDALGNVTTYEWAEIDELNRVTKITGPCSSCGAGGSETQEWTYDASGRVSSYKKGLNEIWSYTYDADGNQDTVTDPLNRTTTYTFDARGRALTVTPPGGGTRTMTYTDAGLASFSDPLSHTATIGRAPNGAVTSVTSARQKTVLLSRNTHGDLESVRDPLNRTTSYQLDTVGRPTSVTDPLNRTTSVQYDAVGRVTRVTLPGGTHTAFGYDRGGRRTSVTDALGRVTRYTYDPYGRLASIADPLNGVTSFGYDVMSRLTSLTDAKGHTTRFDRDAYGRVRSVTYPDGRVESYTYDAAGRLRTRTDRKGVVTTYDRDALGRLRGKTYSDGTPAVSVSYDVRGRIETASNGTDLLTWGYDDADRLLSETSTANASTVSRAYLDDGLPQSLTLDGTEWLSYTWDDASRLRSLVGSGHTFGLDYDNGDRRTSLSFPNGVNTSYEYDTLSRLTNLLAVLGPTPVAQTGYGYDVVGNRTSKTTPAFSEAYTYDGLDRLAGAERGVVGHWHFGYDAVGNRVMSQANDAVVTATYDLANRLLSGTGGGSLVVQGQLDEPGEATVNGQPARMLAGDVFEAAVPSVAGVNIFTVVARDLNGNQRTSTYEVTVPPATTSYGYDANGNLTSKSENGIAWTYEWNAEDQLTRVTKDGAEVARYRYDPLGRRVEKVAGGKTYRYLYDGMDILKETITEGSTTTTHVYVHGPGIDEPLARQNGSGNWSYYHADGLGSIIKATDASGAVVASYDYDAWGNLMTGSAPPDPYGFTGREWDEAAQLWFYRARYYSPRDGRFTSEDPIGFGGGVNFYGYVDGNPTGARDPFGLASWLVDAAHGKYGPASQAYAISQINQNYRGMTDAQIDATVARNLGDAAEDRTIDMVAAMFAGLRGVGAAWDLWNRVPSPSCPRSASDTLDYVDQHGTAPPGFQGGRSFQNREGRLPGVDAQGNPITYREWDTNPYQQGVNRGGERVVTGSDGSAYYTGDHYGTFTRIR